MRPVFTPSRRLDGSHCFGRSPPASISDRIAIGAVQNTPRWREVEFTERKVQRPEEGLIVIAYKANASRDDETYEAYCTTTMRRRGHEDWLVVQHSQLPPIALS